MRKISILILLVIVGILLFGAGVNSVSAYLIENLNFSIEGDIVLGPGKTELWMDSGDEYTKGLLISNRTGKEKLFKVEIEDFRGSRDPNQSIQFLGEGKGPYSLKDYLRPEITEFTLSHGQRMRLQVGVSIPEDAEPGGLYGAILVSARDPEPLEGEIEKEKAKGQLTIISRLASLFFIRVKGDVSEEGALKEFGPDKDFYEKGPISFKVLFENNGSVHLTPYGKIEIKNISGKNIDEIQIDPWFVMPDSSRIREVNWEREFLFGRYTATISLNRGYQDIIDQKSFEFWVIPWKLLSAGLLILIVVIWLIVWIAGHFEIRRKAPQIP